MSILSLLSRRAQKRGPLMLPASECSHHKLTPRWDITSDLGIPDIVVSYRCTTCRSIFTPDEARALGAD